MPAGNTVRPKEWKNIIDLYDDGEYSAVWGNYDGSPKQRLGVRWNEDPEPTGYPRRSGYALWYVEPDWLVGTILQELQKRVQVNPNHGDPNNITTALEEWKRG